MENYVLVNFEKVVEEFLEDAEISLGSEGYIGFIVYTDYLGENKLNFSYEYSSDDNYAYY